MDDQAIKGDGRHAGRPATIYDVARVAGVSHQTVTRYLAGFQGIRPATRARVEVALDQLSYRPNMTARSLRARKSHRIGALAYDLDEVGPSRILRAASEAARDAGYVLDVVSLDAAKEGDFDTAIHLLGQNDLAGIMAGAPTDELRRMLDAASFTVPVVFEAEVDAERGGLQEPSVRGARMMTEHLLQRGHRRIVHLNGPMNWVAARNRAWGYRSAMESAGLATQQIDGGGWSAAHGFRALASHGLPPESTAVFASNDHLALGALQFLHRQGVSVPGEMSVVGFDDVPEAEYFIPPLTTLHQDYDALGRTTILSLLTLMGVDGAPQATPENTLSLVVRASTTDAPSPH